MAISEAALRSDLSSAQTHPRFNELASAKANWMWVLDAKDSRDCESGNGDVCDRCARVRLMFAEATDSVSTASSSSEGRSTAGSWRFTCMSFKLNVTRA